MEKVSFTEYLHILEAIIYGIRELKSIVIKISLVSLTVSLELNKLHKDKKSILKDGPEKESLGSPVKLHSKPYRQSALQSRPPLGQCQVLQVLP